MNSQNSDEIKLQLDEMKKVTTNLMKQLEIISTGLSNSSPPCEKPVENQETPVENQETPVENQENTVVKNEEIVPYVKPQLKIDTPCYSSRKEFYMKFVRHVIKNIDLNDDPLEHHDWNNTNVNFKDSSASKIISHVNSKNDINYVDEVLHGELINKLFKFCCSGQFTVHKSRGNEKGALSFFNLIVMNNMENTSFFYQLSVAPSNYNFTTCIDIVTRVYHNNSLYETRTYSLGPPGSPTLSCSHISVGEMYSIIAD